jgi:hypothetical protein
MGGAAGSLMFSILLAVGVDVMRQKVWTQSEIEALWGVPVLVDIPEILSDSEVAARRKNKMVYAMSSVAGVLVWVLCLYIMYVKHGFILQHLDPVLQKLIYK